MKKTFILFLFTFFSLIISSSFVLALTVKPVSLRESIESAGRIFKGTVTDKTVEKDVYESGLLVAYYTFNVDECLKGACRESPLIIKQVVGWPAGMPEYSVGQTYLVMLGNDSEIGLTAPVGIWQGMYNLQFKEGKWTVPALRSSPNLQQAMKNEAKGLRLGLSPSESGDDYENFKTVVKGIIDEGAK